MLGQVKVSGVYRVNGVDALQVVGQVTVLRTGASGTMTLRGVGWSFSGAVIKARLEANSLDVVLYDGKRKQIAEVGLVWGSARKNAQAIVDLFTLDLAAQDHIGQSLLVMPAATWAAPSPGYVAVSLYGAS